MTYFDSILRGACLVLLLLLATALIRDGVSKLQNRLLLLACCSVGCLLIGLAPFAQSLPPAVFYVVRLFDIPHLVLIWLFGLSLFRHDFHIDWRYFAPGLLYCLPIFWVRLAQFGVLDEISVVAVMLANFFTILLITHLVYSVIAGRKDDLSESRRTARLHFVLLISFMAIVISLSEMIIINVSDSTSIIGTIKAAAMFPAILWTCLWLLRFDSRAFEFDAKDQEFSNWSLNEKTLHNRLEKELTVNRIYLESGITISELADRVAISETKLRAFINTRLGYDNFSAYINKYRIESVKRQFDNPEYSDRSILTIALDNGFASLSPFNRAFSKLEGITPTEYRKLSIKSKC